MARTFCCRFPRRLAARPPSRRPRKRWVALLAPWILVPFMYGCFLLCSRLFGACWGIVAWRTGSIRWTVASHVVLDASGFGALVYLI